MHLLLTFLMTIVVCGVVSVDQSMHTVSRNSTIAAAQKERCTTLYGHRENYNISRKEIPPLLLSAPGSGNTWVRILLEAATGIRTGSVYGDEELAKYLPGEWFCNTTQIVIKAHFPFIPPLQNYEKCVKGGLESIDRAVILHREPFASFWSEYQRRFNEQKRNNNNKRVALPDEDSSTHIVGISVDQFTRDRQHFMSSVTGQAQLFEQMFEQIFLRTSSKHGRRKKKEVALWQQPESYHFVRYEDLINPVTRESELLKVLNFLHSTSDLPDIDRIDRIRCAFHSANQAHRTHSAKEATFQLAWTPEAVCKVWKIVGLTSLKLGYFRPSGDFTCHQGKAIPLNGTACKDGIWHCGGSGNQ